MFNAGPVVLDLTGDDENDADIELFGNTNKVVDQKPHLADAQGQSNNNNGSKDPAAEDYCAVFNFSDVISLDQVMLDQLSTGTGQEYSQIPMPQDPTPVPASFSQVPSPGETPATTSTVFPSPQLSQVHASPVTPAGTYLNRISSQRPLMTSSSQVSVSTFSSQVSIHMLMICLSCRAGGNQFKLRASLLGMFHLWLSLRVSLEYSLASLTVIL